MAFGQAGKPHGTLRSPAAPALRKRPRWGARSRARQVHLHGRGLDRVGRPVAELARGVVIRVAASSWLAAKLKLLIRRPMMLICSTES